MEIVDIEDGVAEIETDYGTYWVSFEVDELGKISEAEIVDFLWADDEYEMPPSEDLILQEAVELIEENISVESEIDAVESEQEVSRLVVAGRKNGSFAVKLETDLLEHEREIFTVLNGDASVLRALRKPLNSLVSSYCRSTRVPDPRYLEGLIAQVMSGFASLWGETSAFSDISRARNFSSRLPIIEQQTAALWLSLLILRCIEAVSNVMMKGLLRDGAESNLYRMRIQQRSTFDAARFRGDYPDLYQKYLITAESEVLTKAMTARAFPLDEVVLRRQFDVALELIRTIPERV